MGEIKDGIHSVTGLCDLCGQVCDPQVQELNSLACSFAGCEGLIYHQDCLEKYLKSIRCEKNRKTGFKCPRGCGKGSKFQEPCKGKIEKSHPIHPRNEEAKQKKKVPDAPPPPPPPKAPQTTAKKDKPQEPKTAKVDPRLAILSKGTGKSMMPSSVAAKLVGADKQKAVVPEPVKVTVQKAAKTDTPAPTKEQLLARVAAERKALGVASTFDSTMGLKLEDARAVKDSRTAAAPGLNPWNKTLQPATTSQQELMEDVTFQVTRQHVARAARPAAVTQQQAAVQHAPIPITQPRPAADAMAAGSKGGDRLPIGMDYVDDDEAGQKLTRAQRKNLRRAEKKKADKVVVDEASQGPSLSVVSTEDQEAMIESKEQEETVAGLFIECLISHKVMGAFKALQQLGFPDWQCAAAVRRSGTALEAAVEWLLEGNVDANEDLESTLPCVPEVDIMDELELLGSFQAAMGLDNATVQWEVINESGDVNKAMANLAAQLASEASGGDQGGLTPSASVYSSIAARRNGSEDMSTSVDSEDLMGLLAGNLSYDGTTTANADLYMDMMAHKQTAAVAHANGMPQQGPARAAPAPAPAPTYHASAMPVSFAAWMRPAAAAPPVPTPAEVHHHHQPPAAQLQDLSGLNARQDPVEQQWTPRGNKAASLIGLNRMASSQSLANGPLSHQPSFGSVRDGLTPDHSGAANANGSMFRSPSFNDNGIEDYRRLLLGDGEAGYDYPSGGGLASVASGFSLFGKDGDSGGPGIWGGPGKGLMGLQHSWGMHVGGHDHIPEAALFHAANVTSETEESELSALMATLVCK